MDPNRTFAFKRALSVNPVLIPVTSVTTPTPVAVDQAAIKAQGVTSFKMSNPTPYWVWYRGWNGLASDMPTIKDMGHYIAPGATDLNTSQIPQWIAAVANAEPGIPADANGSGVLATPGRLVMLYGSGL